MDQKNPIIIGTILVLLVIVFIGVFAIYYSATSYKTKDKIEPQYSNPPIIINKYYQEPTIPSQPSDQYKQTRLDTYSDTQRPSTATYNYYNYNYPSYRLYPYHQGYNRRYYYYPYNSPYYYYPHPGYSRRPPNIYF